MSIILLKKASEKIIFKIIQVIFEQNQTFMNYVNHNKVKIQNWHFFYFFYNFFYNFFSYIYKIYKNLSAKYHQENKDYKKKLVKDIKIFLKKKKKKSNSMAENIAKISWRMKNKHLLSIEKNIEWEKTPFYNYKKHLLLKIKLEAIFKWKKKLKPYIKIG